MTRTEAETAARRFGKTAADFIQVHHPGCDCFEMALRDLLEQTACKTDHDLMVKTAALASYETGRDDGRAAALEEAAKAVCSRCEDGVPIELDDCGCIWHAGPYNQKVCEASEIRLLFTRALAATTKGDGT